MNLKIGSRIFLKKAFIERIVITNDMSNSSLAFGIVAITDYAINLKNLRTGKLYTIPLAEMQGNVDESADLQRPPIAPPKTTEKIEVVTLNSPIKIETPTKPRRDFTYEATATLRFSTATANVVVLKTGDPFAYLYEN
jgi:hypothetical protein